MKFVITKHIQAFKFFKREKKIEGDPEEYLYLSSVHQIMGLKKVYIVLYDFQWDGYPEKDELMHWLKWYGNRGEIYYELGTVR